MMKIAGSGSADPDPLVRGMDPRIRIRIHVKMSWIRNTGILPRAGGVVQVQTAGSSWAGGVAEVQTAGSSWAGGVAEVQTAGCS
jgi:hypothetical protein